MQVNKNTIKKMKNINNSSVTIENKCELLCGRYKLEGNKINLPTFGGKGRYLIPDKIIKSLSSHEYQVNIPIKYNNLEENSIYYVDFRLIKLCESNTWNVILSDLKSIKK